MIPASYLFKTVYHDAWGIGLDTKEVSAEPAVMARRRGLRRVVGALLGVGRAVAVAGKMAYPAPHSRKLNCVQCHG